MSINKIIFCPLICYSFSSDFYNDDWTIKGRIKEIRYRISLVNRKIKFQKSHPSPPAGISNLNSWRSNSIFFTTLCMVDQVVKNQTTVLFFLALPLSVSLFLSLREIRDSIYNPLSSVLNLEIPYVCTSRELRKRIHFRRENNSIETPS